MVAVTVALCGCSGGTVKIVEEAPRMVVSYPKPKAHRLLTDGAIFRNLAASREDAIRG